MITTIERAGRVVIPKSIRERVGLLAGGEVEIIEREGTIEIVPSATDAHIAKTPTGPVFRSDEALPSLDVDTVREVLDQVRR